MKNWFLVYCKPRAEAQAQTNLERQGFPTYLPRVRQRRRRQGQAVIRVEPLFPRYLFVSLDTETDNWAPIRSTLGVSALVRFGGRPAVVPDALVELLRSREDASGVQELPVGEFKPGERVRIAEGPMMGYEGILLARTSRERVLLLLEIIGRPTRVNVDAGHLERAD
jgi:transcriptional antiterminator RfaH